MLNRNLIAAVLLAALLGQATASSELQMKMQLCRLIADTGKRLACYDGLIPAPWGTPVSPVEAGGGSGSVPVVTDVNARFGLPQASSDVLQVLDSHIPGHFSGWRAGTQIRLANNQVWVIADGSEASYDLSNPRIKLRRGMLGSFFLEIEGVAATPKVRRIR